MVVAGIFRVRPFSGVSMCPDTYLAVAYDCHGTTEYLYAPHYRECKTLEEAMDYCENDLRATHVIPLGGKVSPAVEPSTFCGVPRR